MKLEGASTIVTGGGSGLGEATARLLSAKGANLGVLDVDGDKAAAVAADLGGVALVADVTSEDSVRAALAAQAAVFGPARILINCAGIGTGERVLGREGPMPLANFERVVRVNLLGTFNMLRLVAADMAGIAVPSGESRGVIVNTASVAAFEGQIGQAAYSASKGGIVAMGLPLAREFARLGIRVNTIAPGIFLTPLLHTLPEAAQSALAASITYPPRLGDPIEFAHAVLFAIENEYLNAEVIRLDGATRLAAK
ncbi:MAG: SDR family NAD(P)-dependent oxidoreductase [bacterium]